MYRYMGYMYIVTLIYMLHEYASELVHQISLTIHHLLNVVLSFKAQGLKLPCKC